MSEKGDRKCDRKMWQKNVTEKGDRKKWQKKMTEEGYLVYHHAKINAL